MIALVEPCEKYLQSYIEAYDEYKQNDVRTYAFDDARAYDFYISVTADKYEFDNLYNSDVTGIDFMEKFQFEKIIIPERTYAVFETEKQKMPIPEYFDIRKQIAAEWLSNEEYQMINAPELAVYHWGIVGGYTDRTIEIWISIEKK